MIDILGCKEELTDPGNLSWRHCKPEEAIEQWQQSAMIFENLSKRLKNDTSQCTGARKRCREILTTYSGSIGSSIARQKASIIDTVSIERVRGATRKICGDHGVAIQHLCDTACDRNIIW